MGYGQLMDHGQRERAGNDGFHTKGLLIYRGKGTNKHVSRRMVGQLLTVIDLFILANYPVLYNGIFHIFGTRLNRIVDRMRKTRIHGVVLACITA